MEDHSVERVKGPFEKILLVSNEAVNATSHNARCADDRNSRTAELIHEMGEKYPFLHDLIPAIVDRGLVDGHTTESQFFAEGYANAYDLLEYEAYLKNNQLPFLSEEVFNGFSKVPYPPHQLKLLTNSYTVIERENPNFTNFLDSYSAEHEIYNSTWEHMAFLLGGVCVHQALRSQARTYDVLRHQLKNRGGVKMFRNTTQGWLRQVIDEAQT